MTDTRHAACLCGALTAACTGEPVRISVCHCLDCQRRSGSAFAAQARWPEADVAIAGPSQLWRRIGAEGRATDFHRCVTCGALVFYRNESLPGLVAVPLGGFADPAFPPPRVSVFDERRHPWVTVTGIEHVE